jgi:hypothetical protein
MSGKVKDMNWLSKVKEMYAQGKAKGMNVR